MMVPFYDAFKMMSEEGWFCHRSIIDTVHGKFPSASKLHIGVFLKQSTFVLVATDDQSNITQFDTIEDYRDSEDFFAADWEKTCLNTMVTYAFPKMDAMTVRDKLEYDIWPEVFAKVTDKIHPVFFEETIKHIFFANLDTRTVRGPLNPVIKDIDRLKSMCLEYANTLIARIRKSGVKHGIRKCLDVRFKLVARGFVIELTFKTTSNTRPTVVKQVYLMESRKTAARA